MDDFDYEWSPIDEAPVAPVTGWLARMAERARRAAEHDIAQYATTTYHVDGTVTHVPELAR